MVSEVLRTGIQGCVRPLGIMTKSLGEPEISDGWVVQGPQVLRQHAARGSERESVWSYVPQGRLRSGMGSPDVVPTELGRAERSAAGGAPGACGSSASPTRSGTLY